MEDFSTSLEMTNSNTITTPIIGLEIHVELATESKMFCSCKADYFGKEPNTQTCPVCLGFPGALPVPNKKAIEFCHLLGLALDCKINEDSFFERKNYFYPDLPKGYQISQYAKPFCVNGKLMLSNGNTIRINRVHQEEDTGKLQHDNGFTLIDFNRSGVPLVEIVTEPDITSVDQAKEYCEKIQQIVRAVDVSPADMEKGTMRLEPTINLKIDAGGEIFYTPLVELKNINSFRFVKKALEYEIARQSEEFEQDGIQKNTGNKTTRGYDEDKELTYLQRSKEEANDYRYFPEPDIPPFRFTDDDVDGLRLKIPVLAEIINRKLSQKYGISKEYARIISATKDKNDFFEKAVNFGMENGLDAKSIANWFVNQKVDVSLIAPDQFVQSNIKKNKTVSISTEMLDEFVKNVLNANPKAVGDYQNGKVEVLGFLIGQVKRQRPEISVDEVKRAIENKLIKGKQY